MSGSEAGSSSSAMPCRIGGDPSIATAPASIRTITSSVADLISRPVSSVRISGPAQAAAALSSSAAVRDPLGTSCPSGPARSLISVALMINASRFRFRASTYLAAAARDMKRNRRGSSNSNAITGIAQ